MAANMSRREALACFDRCYKKLMMFVFKEDDGTKGSLNLLLDELIALDCSYLGANNEAGNNILKKLSSLIPQNYERLVTKACHVVHNFIKYKLVQQLSGETDRALVEFTVQALKVCSDWAMADILRAVAVLLEDHWEPFLRHEDFLVGKAGNIVSIVAPSKPDVAAVAEATHCLRCLALRTTEKEGMSHSNAVSCFTALLDLLHQIPSLQLHHSLQCRLLVEALQGIHSLVVNAKVPVEPHLGRVLAAVKGYMFHGLGEPMPISPEIFPTITSGYDTQSPIQGATTPLARTDNSTPTSSKTRSRKTRKKKSGTSSEEADAESIGSDVSIESEPTEQLAGGGAGSEGLDSFFQPSGWPRWGSSDSEFSDSEVGQAGGKGHQHSTRVRVAVFGCLTGVCKMVDKRAMFGYWSSFIPDSAASGSCPQMQSLFTSILRDPSPKCRMGALVSLTAMLDGTKQFMAAAEDSSNMRTAFTPLSNVLGAMIRELHKALLQALVVENYNLTLTQLIRCLSTLVMNAPYHRLQPGMLSRVVKQLRHFLSHKDSNVRVACLTCLGAMISHQPPLMEVFHIVQSPSPPVGMTISIPTTKPTPATSTLLAAAALNNSGVDSASASSPNSLTGGEASYLPPSRSVGSSDAGTPTQGTSSPGIHTPVFTDQMLQAQARGTSWLIKLCLKNILPQPPTHTGSSSGTTVMGDSDSAVSGGSDGRVEEVVGGGTTLMEPLPVRLESLQVLATLCKGYFPVIRGQLRLMQGVIHTCLEDQDPAIKLHSCKVLEELGTVLMKEVQDMQNTPPSVPPPTQTLTIQQVQQLWQSVLESPLLDILRQSKCSNPVRASACDSLATIGPHIFSTLSQEQQQQCLKLVLQLTQCSDRLLVSAAVRALGVFVLYPSLSPDVIFVADAANAMLKCLSEPSINVKIKAAWALGNLCDALVVNKDNQDTAFIDQFSDMLLSSMLNAAILATQESDKVKCNAVRALGNILRYLPARSLGKSHMKDAVRNSVQVIIKTMSSGPMKVRWNSCYAMANVMRNPLLFTGETSWLTSVLTALAQVVKDCKNFKVRINAALALAVPAERQHYGDVPLFALVWSSLVESLGTAEYITDFAEFRYKDSLIEQVCLAVLHMLSLCEAEDVCALLCMVESLGPVLQQHMIHIVSNRTSTNMSALRAVRQRLYTLGSNTAVLSGDLAIGLQLLQEICLLDTAEEDLEVTAPRLTAFRQIYD